MEIQWLGHAAFRIGDRGKTVLVDPWFTDNPTFPAAAEADLEAVDFIALTHGHADHVGDAVRLARTYQAKVVAMPEVCQWLANQGIDDCLSMGIGGTVELDGLEFSLVNAVHSSSITEDGVPFYMGAAAGLVVRSGRWAVYHAGDTDIFSDMALIQRIHRPNVGLIPIGGHYTMSPRTVAMACNEFLDLDIVVPMHYGTFPVLAADAEEFAGLLERGRVEVLEPGETLKL